MRILQSAHMHGDEIIHHRVDRLSNLTYAVVNFSGELSLIGLTPDQLDSLAAHAVAAAAELRAALQPTEDRIDETRPA